MEKISRQVMMKKIKRELGMYVLLLRPHVYQSLVNPKVIVATGTDWHAPLLRDGSHAISKTVLFATGLPDLTENGLQYGVL